MRRATRWRHVRAIVVLPGVAAVVVPAVILHFTHGTPLASDLPGLPRIALAVAGVALVVLGLTLMARTIRLFASVGEGTLAPWDPPQKLVVRGIYRRVRNPMLSGVKSIMLGEAALLCSLPLFAWFLAFAVTNALYIRLFEEPGLERRFGEAYREYRRNVPAWIPRLGPWTPPTES